MPIQARCLRGLIAALLIGVASPAFAASGSVDLRVVNAAQSKDRTAVLSLLQNGAYVGGTQPDGTTALHWAVHWGDLEMAELLMLFGANLNAMNDYGATPLSLACEGASGPMVAKLLERGANANLAAPSGETPLMLCARTGSLEAVKALLARGADVNAKDSEEQQTALMWAVAQKHADVAQALIEAGADIHAKTRRGFTPMMFAARVGDSASADALIAAGADVNEVGPQGMTPLVLAAASGQEDFAIHLLDKGADPNAKDEHGATALHYAVMKGITGLAGTSYANYVAYLFRPSLKELVKALLAHKADPNVRLVNSPPLTGSVPVGARAGGQVASGATPYLLAAASPDPEVMRILVDGGANPDIPTNGGITPLMAAAGVARHQDFTEDERRLSLEAVRFALEQGADIASVSDEGLTALHGAAYHGADAVVQLLVEKGAKLDVRDKYQQTPLSIAAGHCLPWIPYGDELCEVIRPSTRDLLLKLGATPLDAPGYFQPPAEYTDAYRINQALRGEPVPVPDGARSLAPSSPAAPTIPFAPR